MGPRAKGCFKCGELSHIAENCEFPGQRGEKGEGLTEGFFPCRRVRDPSLLQLQGSWTRVERLPQPQDRRLEAVLRLWRNRARPG